MPVIETAGLTKRYGDLPAVDGLDLTVERGQIYGFLGPNGAGKTTTMRMLTGLTRPTEGSATVAGVDVRDRDRLGERIGYAPDTPPLYEKLTAREQLAAVADVRGMDRERKRERVPDLCDRFGLDDADERIETYSRGMKQKTSVIQAIVHEPDVVFLDEPTSGLDPNAARTMKTVLAELRDAGTTVFLSTHVLPVVDELADTVGLLYDGELLAEDDPESLKAALAGDSLEDAFVELTTNGNAALGERTESGDDREGDTTPSREPEAERLTDGDGESANRS